MAKKSDDKDGAVAPIIIKKIEAPHGGAHGGAWKIALADMMTAMMAFFLLMWLLGATNEAQRKSIADYFKPTPKSLVELAKGAGADGVLGGRSMLDEEGLPNAAMQTSLFDTMVPPRRTDGDDAEAEPAKDEAQKDAEQSASEAEEAQEAAAKAAEEQRKLEQVAEDIREALAGNPALAELAANVNMVQDENGLRIEMVENADFSMFNLGTSELLPRARELLSAVATAVAATENPISIRGHTDSFGFAGEAQENNWTLSAQRAEATRRLLDDSGVAPARFARIEGAADAEPSVRENPYDARNRRISITLMTTQAKTP